VAPTWKEYSTDVDEILLGTWLHALNQFIVGLGWLIRKVPAVVSRFHSGYVKKNPAEAFQDKRNCCSSRCNCSLNPQQGKEEIETLTLLM
jgi:hypothetical protein